MWLRRALPAALMLFAGLPAQAQEKSAAPTASQETAWYVVRPGDTLSELTTRYLGPGEQWQDNWQLNSEVVEDPNLIYPGQVLELLLPPRLPDDGALLTRIANRVEEWPVPLAELKWTEARNFEILRPRDGIQTRVASSAQLRFGDDTLLMLTEESTVFLGEEKRNQQGRVERRQITVEVGQADLQGPSVAADMTQFEIVLGDATATPRAAEDSALKTRARKAASGAQLMVYSGESELEAAGAKVTVGTGMGSSVPAGKPPATPEKLLPSPSGLEPTDGTKIGTPQPSFSWQVVTGARDYTIEVCRDRECGSLVERVQKLAGTSWQPEELPVEPLYWRVTAISPSGLDGFPSDAMALEVVSDATPPEVRISFTGPQLAPRRGLNRSWILGPGSAIEIEVEDETGGIEDWTAKIDGEEVSAESLQGPWEKGEHELTLTAKDGAGNAAERRVSFIYDPDPPALSWGVEGDAGALGILEAESPQSLAATRRDLRGRRQLRVGKVDWQVDSDLAQIRLRPQTRKPIRLANLGAVGHRRGLWVLADDEVCSDLTNVAYTLIEGADEGDYVLWAKAVDCVGNTIVSQLPLTRESKRK